MIRFGQATEKDKRVKKKLATVFMIIICFYSRVTEGEVGFFLRN